MEAQLLLNRCAVVITPKSPFWDWVNRTSNINDNFLFEATDDGNIYLVPGYESEADIGLAIQNFINQNYRTIFINELEGWNMDPLSFPAITYDQFTEWFTASVHTMIFDMVKKPLKRQ
jgi:hypothetical protein